MLLPSPKKVQFWIENKRNVLLEAEMGVGKSSIILQEFENKYGKDGLGKKFLYFSGATLDPWVDFVGIPEKEQLENGGYVLRLIKPEYFSDNSQIRAIFIDEFNRTHPRIQNAMMELIQFKSINGKKFENLEIVWAAINPYKEDGDYSVEKLDKAIQDRFHVYYQIDYQVDEQFFATKYGKEVAKSAVEYWRELSAKAKAIVSPRRLDYAVEYLKIGGDPADILPQEANPIKFKEKLKFGSTADKLREFVKNIDKKGVQDEVQKYLANPNNFESAFPYLFDLPDDKDDKDNFKLLIPMLSKELFQNSITKLYESDKETARQKFCTLGVMTVDNPSLMDMSKEVLESKTLQSEIREAFSDYLQLFVPQDIAVGEKKAGAGTTPTKAKRGSGGSSALQPE